MTDDKIIIASDFNIDTDIVNIKKPKYLLYYNIVIYILLALSVLIPVISMLTIPSFICIILPFIVCLFITINGASAYSNFYDNLNKKAVEFSNQCSNYKDYVAIELDSLFEETLLSNIHRYYAKYELCYNSANVNPDKTSDMLIIINRCLFNDIEIHGKNRTYYFMYDHSTKLYKLYKVTLYTNITTNPNKFIINSIDSYNTRYNIITSIAYQNKSKLCCHLTFYDKSVYNFINVPELYLQACIDECQYDLIFKYRSIYNMKYSGNNVIFGIDENASYLKSINIYDLPYTFGELQDILIANNWELCNTTNYNELKMYNKDKYMCVVYISNNIVNVNSYILDQYLDEI